MSTLSTNDLLVGIGLVLVLGVGSQLFAKVLRLPPLVVLLRVGFVAGTLTARRLGLADEKATLVLIVGGHEVDFNALAAAELRGDLGVGHVYRVAPHPDEPDLLPPASDAAILGRKDLTVHELHRRLANRARVVQRTADGAARADSRGARIPLFVVDANGAMLPATNDVARAAQPTDRLIELMDSG